MKSLSPLFCSILILALILAGIVPFVNSYSAAPTEPAVAETNDCVADGENVWYIGDSYSDNSFVKDLIGDTFGDIYVNVQSGKSFANSYNGNPSGLDIVKEQLQVADSPKYLIYELGTNDSYVSMVDDLANIHMLRKAVGADTYLILFAPHAPVIDANAFNNALQRATRDDDKILIADWEAAIIGKESEYISSDQLHPNSEGHRLMIRLFREQLDQAVASCL